MFLCISLIRPTWIAQIAPLELTRQPEPAAAAPEFALMAIALGVIAAVICAGLWRARRHKGPELDQAFRGLARRLKLGKRRALLVRKLADTGNVPAVVLLLSEHAFDQAAGALDPVLAHGAVPRHARTQVRYRSPDLSDAALASLKRALFGDQ